MLHRPVQTVNDICLQPDERDSSCRSVYILTDAWIRMRNEERVSVSPPLLKLQRTKSES